MKRLFWLGVGAAAGASGTVWAQRKVRGHIDELGADQVVAVAGRGARSVGRTMKAALNEGRVGMTERELELKGRLLGTEATLDLRRADVPSRDRAPVRSSRSALSGSLESGSGIRRRPR